MKVKIKILKSGVKKPSYAHLGDVGMDVFSLEDKLMLPAEHYIFSVGFALEFDPGYTVLVKDKSSLSSAGIHTVGGVFDAGYRGEYKVQMINLSKREYRIDKGDKIAQLLILPVIIADLVEVEELSNSSRGEGGFGSTGKR